MTHIPPIITSLAKTSPKAKLDVSGVRKLILPQRGALQGGKIDYSGEQKYSLMLPPHPVQDLTPDTSFSSDPHYPLDFSAPSFHAGVPQCCDHGCVLFIFYRLPGGISSTSMAFLTSIY